MDGAGLSGHARHDTYYTVIQLPCSMEDKTASEAGRQAGRRAMGRAIGQLEGIVRDPDKTAQQVGVTVAIGAPGAAVAAAGAAHGLAGGAAIMKALALAGGLVGAGATAGIWVMGIGAVGAGWVAKEAYKKVGGHFKGALPPMDSYNKFPIELWDGNRRVKAWSDFNDAVDDYETASRKSLLSETSWFRCNPSSSPSIIAPVTFFGDRDSFETWLTQALSCDDPPDGSRSSRPRR